MSLRSEVIRIFNELIGSGKKITQLPAVNTPLSGTELLEIVQDGVNKRVAASNLSSGGTGVQSIVAGTNITVDDTDPQNPIVSADGGGGTWGTITGTLSDQTDLQTELNGKQATLVSGTNIKTVNGTTLLGSGDISTTPADSSETVKGIIEIATQTETNTGTDDVRAITPLKAATRYAPLESPALTGTPTAPTATLGTNNTQVATTAFVQAAAASPIGNLLYLYNNYI